MAARVLNRRQTRWNMSLSWFDFVINYRPGKQQGLFDALLRRSYLAPRAGEATFDQQCTTLLKPEQFRIFAVVASINADFLNQVCTATIEDSLARDIKQCSDDDKFKVERDLLYFEKRLYIPQGLARLRVFQSRHNFPAAGHFGFNKTLELISRDFWWSQIWKDVKEFVISCDICSRFKTLRHCPYEFLQPLPVPRRLWSSVSMDFITDLPPSNSFDSIFVVVDRFTKMAHFVPCKKTSSSEYRARLFLDNVYRYHGLPDDIVSNRGTQFVSKFWRCLF